MNRNIRQNSAYWWSRRDAVEDRSPTRPTDVSNSVARTLSGEMRDGWDARDVWLRRIDQPRRQSRRG